MPKQSALSKLDRLERLQGLLSTDASLTVRGLAADLGVSPRTLARDIEILRDQGQIIEGERGRGGGIRLAIGHRRGRITLDAAEAIDLLLASVIAEKMDSPLLLGRLRGIRQKLANVFIAKDKQAIGALRRRILVGRPASTDVLAGYRPHASPAVAEVGRAFLEMRPLTIAYADRKGRITRREIEPHYLLLNMPAWYINAWDRLRDDVRTFRIDRIRAAEVAACRFSPRDPKPFLKMAETAVTAL